MECGDHPTFEDKEEEVQYYKELADQYLREKIELQKESDEFQEESRQFEKELEASLDQYEKANRNLEIERKSLQCENDSLRSKLEQSQREICQLQSELNSLRTELSRHKTYIRELEQKNDDLERAQRVISENVAATESNLNNEIERNALLESEMDEKEQLQMKVQRLMDETRDLKQELLVKERIPDNERHINNGFVHNRNLDSNRLKVETETQTGSPVPPQLSPVKRDSSLTNGNNSMTPSARHSALNLVGDILRKMGTLEAKVAACRLANREGINANGIRDHSRTRRLSRGTSSPSVQGVLH